MNNSFYKAVILTYPYDKKYLTSSKVTRLETLLCLQGTVWVIVPKIGPKSFGAFEKRTQTLFTRIDDSVAW